MGQITNYSYYSKVCEGYAHNYAYTFCLWGDRPHAVCALWASCLVAVGTVALDQGVNRLSMTLDRPAISDACSPVT